MPDGERFLFDEIEKFECEQEMQRNGRLDVNLNLPRDPNGNLYELKNLKGDQLEIARVVLKTLMKWIQ